MTELFTTLRQAVEGTPLVAILVSFVWGVCSVIFSPCHLASIPLIVAFIGGQGPTSPKRSLFISVLFAVGILVTIAVIGLITHATRRMLGDIGPYGNYFVAVFLFVFGLLLLDVIPMPWSGPGQIGMKRKGPLAAFLLGLIFGLALGPCTFAFMGPVLAVTISLPKAELSYGVLLLLVYGVGHCSVIVAAGTSTSLVQRYLNWDEKSKGALILRKVCGVLVILAGVYFIYIAA